MPNYSILVDTRDYRSTFISNFVGWFMVLNATFNNISVISWRSVLLVGETTRVPEINHRPVASH